MFSRKLGFPRAYTQRIFVSAWPSTLAVSRCVRGCAIPYLSWQNRSETAMGSSWHRLSSQRSDTSTTCWISPSMMWRESWEHILMLCSSWNAWPHREEICQVGRGNHIHTQLYNKLATCTDFYLCRVCTGYGILEKLWNFEKEIPYMEKLWNLSKTAVPMEKLWNFLLGGKKCVLS